MNKKDKKNKIDPVCGMDLEYSENITKVSYKNKNFYICGDHCIKRFNKNPEKFLGEPLVKMRSIKKSFLNGDVKTKALRGLSLNIWEGDFVAIIGSSGSGKSTVLQMMGLLDRPSSGKIYFKGENVTNLEDEKRASLRSKVFGFVFQKYHLIPWLTAFENIQLPLIFSRKGNGITKERLLEMFDEIGLGHRTEHLPTQMSGGEQQRTAILRALANDPSMILGDEPTGNLDSETGNKILDILFDLNKKNGKTLVVVTHDADIAKKADQVITLKDGRVVCGQEFYEKIYTE
ncbi:ATP-binding cassette domain-containing protein [Patescibacteria group bacterium]